MINLDYQSRTPIYEQIISQIEKYVALGVLKPKEQIPSIREMASVLGINPNTVKKAYSILESRNILYGNEVNGAKNVLSAAAMTYVAAALMSISQLIRLIAISNRNND